MATFFGPGGFGQGPFDEYLARFFGPGAGAGAARRVDITELMTQKTQELLAGAADYARGLGHDDLDALHVLWAATKEATTREMLEGVQVDPDTFAETVQRQLPAAREAASRAPALTPAGRKVLVDAYQVARALGSTYIGPEHVLLAMSASPDSEAGRLLASAGATPEEFRVSAGGARRSEAATGQATAERDSGTPTLDKYGQDLTARARDGELDPVVGRADEIEQTIEVLSRRTKNNPVLVGEAGVGKTAIVEGIAQRIADGQVPHVLTGKRIVQLDLSSMLAGTRYRGDFEERMTKVIDEISANSGEVIVFIDELHTLVGAGGAEGAVDAGNMLKPRLARGELHVVGATTLDEYRKNIEKDAALERRFQPVQVPEPSVEDTIEVLDRLRDRYAEHHRVRYTDEAVAAAARLSDRYIADRFLPDKAIDLLDQAGARKRLSVVGPSADELEQRIQRLEREKDRSVADEDYERASALRDEIGVAQAELEANRDAGVPEVTESDIAEVVSRATGVPVSRLTEQERTRLRNLEGELHRRVIGQDDAVRALARAVRRSRSGVGNANRPVGSFLFLGPTGVGKTELAKALAETLFGDEDRMIRLDMSEFQERHNAARLIGAPPGYVGYGEAGELTEAVRRRPYSVVLLDEVEKAHPDVFNTLLQVLEDGRLTDGQGRTVDFTNTVVIMTSNLGSEVISSKSGGLGFSAAQDEADESLHDRLMPRLKEAFRPEFLNRIDEVVVFRKLTAEQLHDIADLLLDGTRKRLAAMEIGIGFDDAAVDLIAERGHQPEFGARPLRRTIERDVDDRIADLVLDGELEAGSAVHVGVRDGQLTFEVTQRTPESV
ncbi:ATP-dependent Clp protease ATP-binding subunit ClpC [Saccharopolyspora erythraea NRRL 2338]|uniref:Clp protease ATP binding subunit n=2 Tax=Saccharopolyspora erythraea TaxID=1836 RepID=A4FF35_SACEN|nr:ATP-dependent Clp protease ATP-binding subunit [Saccharopolyspora erythraea]EQD81581.1 ATPase AAA [Saccharopolyspora erythraea D]PFG96385.1 ATP-dependent Clp protease ATP-binding subunit ClpC [Saccharopolyspora erythraea NRRL 2338]CAM02660.1 clp protease ATP binding subunit [Saccharopolyspora erythraea NRRL 2338]